MRLDYYQEQALKTAVYPREMAVVYPAIKLNGEAGEVAEKVGKEIRKNWPVENWPREALAKELGDALWYIAALASDLNYTLSDIAQMNLAKLADRQIRGVLKGEGDER